MNIYWTSYFILNALGAIYEIIKFEIKPDTEYPTNPDIPEFYKQLPIFIKILIKCLTFMVNIVFWLPFKLLKPLLIKGT